MVILPNVTRAPAGPSLSGRLLGGIQHGALSAVAALVAYLPPQALGFREAFWSAITAIAVVQSELHATESTARDQLIGAAVGGILSFGLLLVLGERLWVYGLAVVCSITVCWAVNIVTACRLAGITATIIILVPHTGPAETMLVSRVSEVAWGVCVALGVVWLVTRLLAAPILRPPGLRRGELSASTNVTDVKVNAGEASNGSGSYSPDRLTHPPTRSSPPPG